MELTIGRNCFGSTSSSDVSLSSSTSIANTTEQRRGQQHSRHASHHARAKSHDQAFLVVFDNPLHVGADRRLQPLVFVQRPAIRAKRDDEQRGIRRTCGAGRFASEKWERQHWALSKKNVT